MRRLHALLTTATSAASTRSPLAVTATPATSERTPLAATEVATPTVVATPTEVATAAVPPALAAASAPESTTIASAETSSAPASARRCLEPVLLGACLAVRVWRRGERLWCSGRRACRGRPELVVQRRDRGEATVVLVCPVQCGVIRRRRDLSVSLTN